MTILPSKFSNQFSLVHFSCSVTSDSLQHHGLQHARPPCPLLTPEVYPNSRPLSWWCHPTISSSVIPFPCLQSFPASGSFLFFFFSLFVVNFVIHWNEKALGSHVFPIPIPPPTSLHTRSLQVLPGHQVRALVSCIQPGPVICFTLDSIHVSMLFSWNIPPSPSPTESKRLFYKSVSLFLFCI